MSVTLRWKSYTNGTKSAYLDIYSKGSRRKEFIGIKINKSDTDKKEKRIKAQQIRTKRHNDLIDNKYGIVSKDKGQINFIKYFESFISNYNKAGINKYKASFESFKTFLKSEKKKDQITFENLNHSICFDFKEYLNSTKSNLHNETPYDYFKRFRTVINKAHDEGYFNINPCLKIINRKPKQTIAKQILTESELQILADTECGNDEIKRAFLFCCFTGLGEAEIKQLQWSNISNDRLNIKRAKNGASIKSKLPKTAIVLLGEIINENELIFKLPSNTSINSTIETWTKKAGINKHITFYCARHTFAVMNLRKGADLSVIQKLMGHTDITTTVKYLKLIEDDKDEAMDNLPELIL